jgi:hypothetical protein
MSIVLLIASLRTILGFGPFAAKIRFFISPSTPRYPGVATSCARSVVG